MWKKRSAVSTVNGAAATGSGSRHTWAQPTSPWCAVDGGCSCLFQDSAVTFVEDRSQDDVLRRTWSVFQVTHLFNKKIARIRNKHRHFPGSMGGAPQKR